MTPRLGHAIVGCGRIAPTHADAFARLPEVSLLHACDVVEGQAAALARDFGIGRVTTAYAEVLADPAVGSLSLAVPHDLHGPMTLAAIAAGKHVLVEKPFVIDPEDGRRVIAAAHRAEVVVMPVSQHRFDPLVRLIAELVAEGRLGRLCLVRGHLDCVRPPEYYRDSPWRGSWQREGGSVLINQAYHLVDLLLWLAGPAARVTAHMATLANAAVMETEDTVAASLVFASGALGTLSVSGAAGSLWRSAIELLGTEGVIEFDINYPNAVRRLHLTDRRALKAWRVRFETCQASRPPTPPAGLTYYGTSHREQARAFVDAVQGGPEAGGASLEQALEVVRLIQDMYGAARDAAPAAPAPSRG
jgi:predicted dehydrogenase